MLTGSIGYVGKNVACLLADGHEVACLVSDKVSLDIKNYKPEQVTVIEGDLMKLDTLSKLPKDINAADYLVHSMNMKGDFSKEEKRSAENFVAFS